ncbi:MAG TPA: hypothetical protein VM680_18620 [Verrucomicrobiae bacterium]|nr:hypothetical protein [Verrucomicrobiae bacterium]
MKKLLFILPLFALTTFSATRHAVVSGDWNNIATWSTTSGGAGGASVPVSGDTVNINGDIVVTIPSGYSAASGTCIVGNTANTSGISTLINNGTYAYDGGTSLRIGQGTGKDGKLVLGPGSTTTLNSGSLYLQNCIVESTATANQIAIVNGVGQISTTGVTGPTQDINLSHVSFRHTGSVTDFRCQGTTGAQTSRLILNRCVFVGTASINLGATDSPNSTVISVTNTDFRDMIGTRTITMRRTSGGAATYLFQHNSIVQPVSFGNRITFVVTTSGGVTVDGNVMLNCICNETAVANTWSNNLYTLLNTTSSGNLFLSDAGTGSTATFNYCFSTKDGGANLHPIQTTSSGGSGTHTVNNNLMDAYADATNDKPDLFMPGNTTTTLSINFYGNIVIYSGELFNGAHLPTAPAGPGGYVIRNNTVAGTAPVAIVDSGSIVRPEVNFMPGNIVIRSNLHLGNGKSGEFSIAGGHTTGPQVYASSDYNNISGVTTPYANDTGGLTITAGNTGKTVPGANDTANAPRFFDQRRDMAVWNGIFGSGTATRDACSTYWESLNGYRGTPNFDQQGTATAYTPRQMLDWVAYGYSPTNLSLRGAGDPTDGANDQGAMPVRSKTTPFFF